MEISPEKPDITSYADLELLVHQFYARLLVDPLIKHFFTTVVELDLEHHIPRIASFWEMTLFQRGAFTGDPMAVHLRLNGQSPMEAAHFERWLEHWSETIDSLFAGPYAELARQRARSIATIMQVKMHRTT